MNPVLSFILSFFLFAFITNLSPNNAIEQVLDIHGIPLTSDRQYYIFPASENPSSGGLTLNKIGDLECPVTVLQNNDVTGLPVQFSILEDSTGNIMTSTDLEIEFTKKPDCAESSKWTLFVDPNTQLGCVGIGGSANYPGIFTYHGKFLIEKHGSEHVYRLGFCLNRNCFYIGLKMFNSNEGGSRLIWTAIDAYSVVFVDAAFVKSKNTMSKGNPNIALPI